jgi:hypothetical protein
MHSNPTTCPTAPLAPPQAMPPRPDPLRRPEVLTLDLTTEQAAQFSGLGEAFAVIGKGSYPGHVGRLCLYALPVPHDVATACCNVALGLARAVKLKPAKP